MRYSLSASEWRQIDSIGTCQSQHTVQYGMSLVFFFFFPPLPVSFSLSWKVPTTLTTTNTDASLHILVSGISEHDGPPLDPQTTRRLAFPGSISTSAAAPAPMQDQSSQSSSSYSSTVPNVWSNVSVPPSNSQSLAGG